jgi:hypothetical protein
MTINVPKKADGDGHPAPDADSFAQHDRAQNRYHEWCDKADGDGVGQRHIGDGHDKQRRRKRRQRAPPHLQERVLCPEDAGASQAQHEHDPQKEAQLSRPCDLDRVKAVGQEFRMGIDGREQEHTARHERNPAQAIGLVFFERRICRQHCERCDMGSPGSALASAMRMPIKACCSD